MKKIGLIGFGAMGSRIAKNLIDAGYQVKGFNRDGLKVKRVSGVVLANCPAQVAKGVDLVIAMVRDDEASQQIWLDEQIGVIAGIGPGTVAVDMSTLSAQWSTKLAHSMNKRGIEFLEAPVVGTRPQAEAKELIVLAAGSDLAFEKAQSVLLSTAAKVINLGSAGKAAALKLAINTLFGIQTAAFAEVIEGLRQSGFTNQKITSILPELAVTSPIMKVMMTLMIDQKFAPMFPIELVEKDFCYSADWLESAGGRANLTQATKGIYQSAMDQGLGDRNMSAIIEFYRQKGKY